MLIVTRKKEQSICIYPSDELDNKDCLVQVYFLDIDRNIIKVGIDAPPNITVHREEVYQRIILQNKLKGE